MMLDAVRENWERIRSFFRNAPLDREFEAEIASHLAFAVDENTRNGMSPEEARRRALVRFGGIQQSREQHREARGLPALEALVRDVRYALRTLGRDPGFTAIAVLMLGLAIGANVTVFSVVNGLLLRPLPFRNPQELVVIAPLSSIAPKGSASALSGFTYTADAFDEFRAWNRSFADVAAYFAFSPPENVHLRGAGDPVPVSGIQVTGSFFQTLGVAPQLGRLFTAEEFQRNGRAAVLLSYPFWRRQFAGDSGIVGKTVNFDGKPVTVVGVLPDAFDFGAVFSPGSAIDVFTPAILDDMRNYGYGRVLMVFGRLKTGVSLAQANAEGGVLGPQLDFSTRFHSKGYFSVGVSPLRDYVSGKLRRALIVLWCAVGLVLLIVCVNLSNLLLVRAAARSREFALRGALGAGRRRLIAHLLTESFVLAAGGVMLGLAISYGVTEWLARQTSVALPLLNTVRVDSTALAWTLLISVAAAVLFGVLPGIRMSGIDLLSSIKEGGHGMSPGRTHQRLRAALVASEVALACVLLVGAGLLLRSFLRVLDVDLGFNAEHTAYIHMDYADGTPGPQRAGVREELLQRVKAIAGIEDAAITDNLPLEGNRSLGLWAKNAQLGPRDYPLAFAYVITPGYFRAMGMRLIEGRDFDWGDRAGSPPVVILNETAARQLWPGQDPLDHVVIVNGNSGQSSGNGEARVVGVVPDVHEISPEGQAGPQMYLPAGPNQMVGTILVIRGSLPLNVLETSVMRVLKAINPTQPAYKLRPVQSSVDRAVSPRRFFMLLVAAFAALGLILAALGVYGVISYGVVQQTHEIGIRMALGATAGRVQRAVLSRTFRLTVAGLAVGIAVSFGVGRVIGSLLFGTQPTDFVTFAGMAMLLGIAALIAGFLPSRRASHVDPIVALRTN